MALLLRAAFTVTRPIRLRKWPGPLVAFDPRAETKDRFPPFTSAASPVESDQSVPRGRARLCRRASLAPKDEAPYQW
jgi:hypothetical protein